MKEDLNQETVSPETQQVVQVVERLTDGDKSVLEIIKLKREVALAHAKTALAQSESAELAYNNVVLQLAMRYRLSDGDVINDDGTIQRKSQS
jgi:hypothetical protein